MFHLFSMIISYGALLLLFTVATGINAAITALLFVLGSGLAFYKKVYETVFWKTKNYLLMAAAAFIVASFGLIFNKKRKLIWHLQAFADFIHMPKNTMRTIVAILLSVLAIYSCYIILSVIIEKISEKDLQNNFLMTLILCICVSILTVILSQVMFDVYALSMGNAKFAWCVLIVLSAILFLYCLIGKIIPPIFITLIVFAVISTVNVYVYRFRERLFEPVDIFSAITALNVSSNYSLFPIPVNLIACWFGFIAILLCVFRFYRKKQKWLDLKKRVVLLVACLVSFAAIYTYAGDLKTYHWYKQGATYNGYILDFVAKFKEISAPEPDNYSTDLVAAIADYYSYDDEEETDDTQSHPHIIVIMDETFSDLSVVGDFNTNVEVAPFVSSLRENAISGYALSSVHGGNTANSEWEFLTGNSIAWLSPNVVPYQQYLRSPTYSMATYLKSDYNYKCIAMHPYYSSGWNRPTAYSYMGFDEWHFIEDFPQENYLRKYISDQEVFEYLIETFESEKENPLFLWTVTMQNHGSYTYSGDNFTPEVSLTDYDQYPEVEQYLSVIHETDKAVEYLISYFENVDEDVIIVFYGDHQPKISRSFYEDISGTTASTLDEMQKRYTVPFFIWTNFDSEEQYKERTSLNYLSTYVYELANIELPLYNRFLKDMESVIPAINSNGFYSLAAGGYLPIEQANEEEKKWLDAYEILQYNNLFDKSNQNKDLFPTIE